MVEKAIFQALVFLFPTQLALHFWPNWAHIFGIRVDYLSPTIYLTDLLVGLLFIFWIRGRPKISKKAIMWGTAFLLFVVLNIYFSQNILLATFRWLKVLEFIFLGVYVASKKSFRIEQWVIQPLILSVITFSIIGIAQFLLQKTIGGIFYYLGERNFSSATPGIALIEIIGRNYLRIYSTFPHPNSLGGYLAVSLCLILGFANNSKLKIAAILICILGIILSFSLGAYLGLFLVEVVYLFQNKIQKKGIILIFSGIIFLSLVLPFLSKSFLMEKFSDNQTIMRRLALAEISQEMIFQKPFLGVGLNNFLPALSRQTLYSQVSWWLQPVHNIFLLVLAETGIVGLSIFVFLIFKTLIYLTENKNWQLIIPFLFILFTGTVDHYWLTLQQNLLLFSLVFGLSFTKWKKN
jgi:O-antigen ligase